jgi:hypothetical protein
MAKKSKASAKKSKELTLELKHKLYEKSVQNHGADIEFLEEEFEKLKGRAPQTLREDFGGTGAMACDWVKRGSNKKAWAIDLDDEPVNYGKKNHLTKLNKEEQSRMHYVMGNVLEPSKVKTDVIVAFNFSYFIFKKRAVLLKYFKEVYKSLEKDGAFFVDIFGGTECFQEMVEETEFDHHSYYWDCHDYNPLTSEVTYYIHFKKNGVKYNKAFIYEWRHWSVREITEIMEEAGFSKTLTYWEGEDEDGDGDGIFTVSEKEENCESWVIYIAGLK